MRVLRPARVDRPSLALRFAFARGRAGGARCRILQPETDARARTCVRARCPLPAPDRRPLRVGRLFPFGRPTRESHVDLRRRPGRASRRAVSPLYALRVSRPRRLSRARPPVPRGGVAGFRRSAAYVDGARHSSAPLRPVPRFEARSRTTRDDFMTSDVGRGLRVKDLSAPTPQGSGARRVPLLAGPRAPSVITPGASVAGEPRTSWRCEPGATEILVRAAPREGGGVPEDQGAWNRSVSRCRGRVAPSCRSTGLRPTPPLAGCCRCGEPALGPPSRPASR